MAASKRISNKTHRHNKLLPLASALLLSCWVIFTWYYSIHHLSTKTKSSQLRPFRDRPTDDVAETIHEEPFCDTAYLLNEEYHTQYAKGQWVATGESASCTVIDDVSVVGTKPSPYWHTGPHLQCLAPSTWNISVGSARQAAEYTCDYSVERECTNIKFNNSLSEEVRIHEAMRWEWYPTDGCRMHSWNKEHMIQPNTRMFMVGDSITTDQGDALRCTLPTNVQEQLKIVRNDDLGYSLMNNGTDEREGRKIANLIDPEISPTDLIQRAKDALNEFWQGVFESNNPLDTVNDILLLNTGAHWTVEPAQAEKLFQLVASAIKDNFRGMVIFRTNVMGHNECHRFSSPLPHDDEQIQKKMYNWADFRAYNEAVVRAFQSEGVPNFRVLDLSMFESRPDGHVMYGDCLHYCKPGIPDVWNKNFLFHVIHQKPSTAT